MDRQEMLDQLSKLGMPTADITDAVDDKVLASFLQTLQHGQGAPDAHAEFADDDEEKKDDDGDDDGDEDDYEADHDTGDETDAKDEDEPETEDHAEEAAQTMPGVDGEEGGEGGQEGEEAEQHAEEFAEMTRMEMEAALQNAGHNAAELEQMDDAEMESLYNSDVAGGETEKPPDSSMADEFADEPETPAAESPSRQEMTDALVAHGHEQAQLESLEDDELQQLYDAEIGSEAVQKNADIQPYSEDAPNADEIQPGQVGGEEALHGGVPENPGLPDDPQNSDIAHDQNQPPPGGVLTQQEVKKMSETAQRTALRNMVKEVIDAELTPALNTAKEQVGELLQAPKRQNIRNFCEQKVRDGKLLRVQVEPTIARLLRAGTQPIHKFSDKTGKAVRKSELDCQLEEIENGPLVAKYAERIAQPLTKGSTEVEALKNHVRRYSETYAKSGQTVGKMVKAYKIYRRTHPNATYRQFLGKEPREDQE